MEFKLFNEFTIRLMSLCYSTTERFNEVLSVSMYVCNHTFSAISNELYFNLPIIQLACFIITPGNIYVFP